MVTAAQKAQRRWHDQPMNEELIDAFILFMAAQNLSQATIDNRRYILAPLSRFIDKPFTEATTHDLRAYLARGLNKPASVRVERAAMLAFFEFLKDEGYRHDDPATRLAPVKVPKGKPRPFTRTQIRDMLNHSKRHRTKAMIKLGYYQGFRVSQIARVRGDDIQGDRIHTVAKGSKSRWLPLSPAIAELAKSMPEGWWFASPYKDGPIKSESVTETITTAIHRAGITDPSLTPHSLRHSFGSELVEQGVDIRVIQELMLHDDLSTTQVYTQVSDDRKMAGIVSLPSLDNPLRLVA